MKNILKPKTISKKFSTCGTVKLYEGHLFSDGLVKKFAFSRKVTSDEDLKTSYKQLFLRDSKFYQDLI